MTHSSSQAVDARVDGKILVITLATPGELNVLSRPVAKQLTSILCEVPRAGVDAVVLRSAKPKSFVNGVGLMLAGAVQTPEDVTRLTAEVRTCYRMLQTIEVPTIAAIRGNCYGCGVELVLRCDHRVAADDFDTHFYMPEVPDYLFVPCFGGTFHLPRLLGLPRASELVLWGRRWSGAEAARARLVDVCVSTDDFDEAVMEYARDIVADRRPPATAAGPALVDADWVDGMSMRIHALPPVYQPVYRECFELMHRAATGMGNEASATGRELLAAGRTVVASSSKAAQSFFFVAQTARLISIAGAPEHARYRLVPAARSDLLAEIASRRSHDVVVGPREPGHHADDVELTVGSFAAPARTIAWTEPMPRPFDFAGAEAIAYAPLLHAGSELVEVACPPHGFTAATALSDALDRAGMRVVLTSPSRKTVTDDLIDAYLHPLTAWIDAGGDVAAVGSTLHGHGRVRPLSDLAGAIPPDHPGREATACLPGRGAITDAILDALAVSLAAAAIRSIESGAARHPSVVDVIARHAIDWPLAHGSLCRWLTIERLSEVLERADSFANLVRPSDRERVQSWVARGRSFYR